MTVSVIQFGGSNCDRDTVQALESLNVDAELVWHEDSLPADIDGVVLPGGFSYGDYLRAGAMAAHSPIMDEVRDAAEAGTPVLGICNGAQVGCESSLTPGAFTTNESARFQCEHVHVRVENADTPWTRAYEEGEVIEHRDQVIPVMRLGEVLDVQSPDAGGQRTDRFTEEQDAYAVVVNVAHRRAALVVDELISQEEVVIKSLGDYLKSVPGIAGSTILGDGQVIMVLDIGEMIQHEEFAAEEEGAEAADADGVPAASSK